MRFGVRGVVSRIGYLRFAPGLLLNGIPVQAQLMALLGKLEATPGEAVNYDANQRFCLEGLHRAAIKTYIDTTQVNHRQISYETSPSTQRSSITSATP